MNLYVVGVAAVLGLLIMKGLAGGQGKDSSGDGGGTGITRSNPWKLPDIDSSIQGGSYSTSFDENFEKASGATSVPFALLKAHAIRESSLNARATHFDNEKVGSSYGLMQVEWLYGSNRFQKYGYSDEDIGRDGSKLFDPDTNCYIGACIIADNLNWLKGNVRDAINAYNTGTTETKHAAPHNYVNDVVSYYETIVGGKVT